MIDGKLLAASILDTLRTDVQKLSTNNIHPTLGVLLVGDDPGSVSYIRQKQKAAQAIGAQLRLITLADTATPENISHVIYDFNHDPTVHGVIVQRPIPRQIGDVSTILDTVITEKDVDGFNPASAFPVPVAAATVKILEYGYTHFLSSSKSFTSWITQQRIAVIGRGETAGKPIAQLFRKLGVDVSVIHSSTSNTAEILHASDIIISCAGKADIIKPTDFRPGTIIIGVGLWRDTMGKLHGDFNEASVGPLTGFYTPTPGGVGPVNVACLIENVIQACIKQQGGKP